MQGSNSACAESDEVSPHSPSSNSRLFSFDIIFPFTSRSSVVGIAPRLRTVRLGVRILVGVRNFFFSSPKRLPSFLFNGCRDMKLTTHPLLMLRLRLYTTFPPVCLHGVDITLLFSLHRLGLHGDKWTVAVIMLFCCHSFLPSDFHFCCYVISIECCDWSGPGERGSFPGRAREFFVLYSVQADFGAPNA